MFYASYVRISIFIPIFATLPMYLAKKLSFGDIMQTRAAFARVQDGFGWFLDVYKQLIVWAAVVERLARFQEALEQQPALETPASSGDTLQTADLSLATADGRALLTGIDLSARAPDWLLLDGASGIGKTTLLRTLAGIWPYYRGRYQLPSPCGGGAGVTHEKGESLFHGDTGGGVRPHTSLPDRPPTITTILSLPQRPYLPHDTLRANLCYPARDGIDDAILKRALEQVGLAQLQDQLDCEDAWGNRLSGGEQQRLSLARALIARPHILYLDEATNQLDDAVACRLMQTLKTALPDTLCLAISHQAAIKALFTRQIDLNRYRAPAGLE